MTHDERIAARKLAQKALKRRASFMREVTLPAHRIRKILNKYSMGCLWTNESTKGDMAEAYALSMPEIIQDMYPCAILEDTFDVLVAESLKAAMEVKA